MLFKLSPLSNTQQTISLSLASLSFVAFQYQWTLSCLQIQESKQENFFFCFSEPLTTLHTSSMPPWVYTLSRKTLSFPSPHSLKFFSLIFCYFFLTILSLLSGFLSAVEWPELDTVLRIRPDADKRNSIAISCCSPQTYPVHYRELISSFPPRLLHDNEAQDESVVIPGSAKEAGTDRREDGVRNRV